MDSIVIVPIKKSLTVRFGSSDSNGVVFDDGEFQIHYDTEQHPNQIVVKETAGLPGSIKGQANELLYVEQFGNPSEFKPFRGFPTFFDSWQQRVASVYRERGFQWVSNDNGDVYLQNGEHRVLLMRSEYVYHNGVRASVHSEEQRQRIIEATPEYDVFLDALIWSCFYYLNDLAVAKQAAREWSDSDRKMPLYDWLRDRRGTLEQK
jgi:hypothetical protein